MEKRCSVDGCERIAQSRGWCSAHYTRWRRHGSPLTVLRDAGPAECGTYGGYQAHRKKSETPCDACREASREYMRSYRSEKPQARELERVRNNARSRALWRLVERHPAEFEELYLDEIGPAKRAAP